DISTSRIAWASPAVPLTLADFRGSFLIFPASGVLPGFGRALADLSGASLRSPLRIGFNYEL
ncbi:MAG: hypothetical protein K2I08_11940, partial [Muribaculaceae bacterium]|nr:hypothetical protein [Muribaculaceae bacterium]